MPGRREHDAMGAIVGLLTGLATMGEVPEDMRLLYVIGSTVGGVGGARLPDILEPGVSSWHRRTCHSLTVGGFLGRAALVPPLAMQSYVRRVRSGAFDLRARRKSLPSGDGSAASLWRAEAGRYFLLGAAAGAIPGYLSHLALDAGTPRYLPII